ncbi:MAG: hypothetical protein MZV49_10170 [Rhodopseudomonas palustris]|nr:hypothetical protein [Rhodopseudomonas palustris]
MAAPPRRRPIPIAPRWQGQPQAGVPRKASILSPDDPRYGRPATPPAYSGAQEVRRRARFCRPMIRVMAVRPDRRR